jgi:adenylate kinase
MFVSYHLTARRRQGRETAAVRIVLLGPPGCGKGTQASALSAHLGLPVISSGELLRAKSKDGSEEGARIGALMAKGELVADDVVMALVDAAAGAATGGYLLDGFPRTISQAEQSAALPADVVVLIDIPESVSRERIANRARTSGRTDDVSGVIETRLAEYRDETVPLVDYFADWGVLVTVDGSGSPEEVTGLILGAIGTT